MAKNTLIISILAIMTMLLSVNSYSEVSKAKIKVSVSPIPGVMTAGESYDITVTVRNVSKRTWYSDGLNAESDGNFSIVKMTQNISIGPKETGEIIFRITAPRIADVYDFKFSLSDNGRKAITRKKIIEVKDNPAIDRTK